MLQSVNPFAGPFAGHRGCNGDHSEDNELCSDSSAVGEEKEDLAIGPCLGQRIVELVRCRPQGMPYHVALEAIVSGLGLDIDVNLIREVTFEYFVVPSTCKALLTMHARAWCALSGSCDAHQKT